MLKKRVVWCCTLLLLNRRSLHGAIQVVEACNKSRKWVLLDELKTCSITKNLQRGKQIHAELLDNRNAACIHAATALVSMYSRCGRMVDAHLVFDCTRHPNAALWTALIFGYAANGESLTALEMFAKMKSEACTPNSFTFVAALKAITSLLDQNGRDKAECLARGKEIHSQIGSHSNVYVQNTLINMYAKCSSMVDAQAVFDSMNHRDTVSWNALILGYADSGKGQTALDLFARMKLQTCSPTSVTFVAALKACASIADIHLGRRLHQEVGWHSHLYVRNTLIDMYAKCGSMVDAQVVFDNIKHPDSVSWTVLIMGYAENGQGNTALNLLTTMRSQGWSPDSFTFLAAIKACTSLALERGASERAECVLRGKQIHLQIDASHLSFKVQSALIEMYAKCGCMDEARQVFDKIKQPDVVSWTATILGYADNGDGISALDLFAKMKACGCQPDDLTFVAALKGCTALTLKREVAECLDRGKQLHSEVGRHLTIYVQSALIDMYANCGSMVNARQVFETVTQPDVVLWTALILGYAEHGEGLTALDLFTKMKLQGFAPDSLTFVAALKGCISLIMDQETDECLERVKQIHMEIGSCSNIYVQNTLMDMYARCGYMTEAHSVFDRMKEPDVVSWSTLILGYAENGDGVTALDLFSRMKSQGQAPALGTLAAALKACGVLGDLELGSRIHAEMTSAGGECDASVVTALVDFYTKCGCLEKAQQVFDSHPRTRRLTTWTALLAGYSRLGDTRTVFKLFEEMREAGFQPSAVTFVCILTCCSHAGLLEKANEFFEAMPTKHGVAPTLEHYNCMVDILGRSNKLDDAMALVWSMPFRTNSVTWRTILGGCRKWKNVWIGRLAFMCLVSLDNTSASAYVLMAHIYGSRGMWQEQDLVLGMKHKLTS